MIIGRPVGGLKSFLFAGAASVPCVTYRTDSVSFVRANLHRRWIVDGAQQYIIHSTTPISIVAATNPKISAARSTGLPLSSVISSAWSVTRPLLVATVVCATVSCNEATAPALRFGVLDDVGQNDWQSVSVGGDHSCGLKTTGTVFCWGSNRYFQVGVVRADTSCGSTSARFNCAMIPVAIQQGVQFTSISAGARHTCAIDTSREAYCWGGNDLGQVNELAPLASSVPTRVQGSLGYTQISAGYSHSCAVRTDGALFCWGANDRGQLGNGVIGSVSGMQRVQINVPVASVSAGQGRSCARTTLGAVYCWGATWTERNGGLEITRAQTTPLLVPNSPAMSWVSVGTFTTCGADVSGFAYCWEANPRGEMGNGTKDGSTSPTRVSSDLEFVQVAAGIVQSCGVVTSGAGYCWGDNTFGQLGSPPGLLLDSCGDQTLPCATVPTPVFGTQKFTEISTGFGSHSCGVTVRGNLYCWGLGFSGQRGDGTAGYVISVPVQVMERRR